MTEYNFGECWYVDMNPVKGHEQGMERTVIIISDDIYNKVNGTLRLVVPVSTSEKYGGDARWIHNPWIQPLPENNFGTSGYILANQLRTIDMKARSITKWGVLSKTELLKTLEAVHFSLPEIG